MLLILTSDKDFTADFLITELIKRNQPYFRVNAEDLASAGFSFSLSGDKVLRKISIREKILDLDEVRAVWYRRAVHPVPSISHSPAERAFVAAELRHLAMGLILNPAVTWVNPIDRVSVAEYKLYQLQVARQVGFRVPRTLVSRDAAELRRFCDGNEAGTICKPIYHGLFVDGADAYSIYTRRVTPDSFDTGSVSACAVFLQEEILRSADVRATFIGQRCFVADIMGDPSLVDWRDPDVAVSYSASTLGREVERMCRTMLERLGLVYGAFDFLRTREGDLVFLEINPTGEWAWLEDRLGFPMRDAFIHLFYGDR